MPTIRRSIRYDGSRHKNIIGPTKRKKVRIVDFGDTLAEILRNARKEQLKNRMQYGELYHKNYYREVKDKNRVYYEFYHLDGTENVPEDYKEISFVCLRPDGSLELPSTLGIVCRKIAQKLDGFEGFHFHQLRHTYTSNLLANGAAPKDVQELLGHSDVSSISSFIKWYTDVNIGCFDFADISAILTNFVSIISSVPEYG